MRLGIRMLPALAAAAVTVVQPAEVLAQRMVNLPEADRALSGAPSEVFRVGVEEGNRNEAFSAITGVGFDGAGNLYVLDRDNARIVVFDRNGRFLRSVGSKGQGPGEFTFPIGLAVFPDARLAVMDLGNRGISVFNASGEYADLVSPDPRLVQPQPSLALIPSRGNSVLVAGAQITASPNAPPVVTDSVPIVRVGLDGSSEVVYRAFNKGPELSVSGTANQQEVRLSSPPAYTAQMTWTGLPGGGIAVSPGLQYEVLIVSATGDVATVIRRPVQPRRTGDRDRELARDQLREQMESGSGRISIQETNGRRSFSAGGRGAPRQEIEQRVAALQFAEQVPLVRRLTADPAGNIWVLKDGGPGVEDLPIDIISSTGEYRGTVRGIELPDAFGPDGLVAFIETDDLGVQRVAVKRLPQSWR